MKNGASQVIAFATHGVFSNGAFERIEKSELLEVNRFNSSRRELAALQKTPGDHTLAVAGRSNRTPPSRKVALCTFPRSRVELILSACDFQKFPGH